jgi:hypothetical protein
VDTDRLKELLAKATPTPWAGLSVSARGWGIGKIEDRDLIVAAVNALPGLLAENNLLREQITGYKGTLKMRLKAFREVRQERDQYRRDLSDAIVDDPTNGLAVIEVQRLRRKNEKLRYARNKAVRERDEARAALSVGADKDRE